MNYIKQLNEFYSTLDYKPLPANSIAIYTLLLQIANRTGWIDKFKVANTILMSKSDLDMQKLIRARNKLINQGYITYLKGKNQTEAPTYSIIQLYNDKANNIADDIANNIADNIADNMANNTINKQNETKQIKKENQKRKATEFDDVLNQRIQDENVKSAFYDFIKMRKAIKKPLTTKALELAIDRLNKLSTNKDEQILILNKSIMNTWQGLFPLKEEDKKELNSKKEYKENKITEEEYHRSGGDKRYV